MFPYAAPRNPALLEYIERSAQASLQSTSQTLTAGLISPVADDAQSAPPVFADSCRSSLRGATRVLRHHCITRFKSSYHHWGACWQGFVL